MVAVMIFGAVFMVGFGIWHAPILEFASEALPNLSETMAQISTNSTSVGEGIGNSSSGTGIPGALSHLSATYILKNAS
jgi:F420H2 dehydrogenase subunit N